MIAKRSRLIFFPTRRSGTGSWMTATEGTVRSGKKGHSDRRSDPDRSFSEACIRNLLYGIGSAGEEGNYEKKEKIEISGNCGSTCFDRDTLYVLLSGRLPMVYRFTMGDDACGIEDRARRSLCGRGLRSDQKDHSSDSISAKSLDDDRS